MITDEKGVASREPILSQEELISKASRLKEYFRNAHHINPMSERYTRLIDDTVETLRIIAEIVPASPALSAQDTGAIAGVRVKDLQWKTGDVDTAYHFASSSIQNYIITVFEDESQFTVRLLGTTEYGEWFETLEAAKAAAQADYSARILSALEPQERDGWKLVPVEPTEEMLDAYWKQTGESKEMRSRTHDYMRRYWSVMLDAAPPHTEGK